MNRNNEIGECPCGAEHPNENPCDVCGEICCGDCTHQCERCGAVGCEACMISMIDGWACKDGDS